MLQMQVQNNVHGLKGYNGIIVINVKAKRNINLKHAVSLFSHSLCLLLRDTKHGHVFKQITIKCKNEIIYGLMLTD
jgi:hypothetical protein